MEFHVTAEQEEAVEKIVAKWQAIANTTNPINQQQATEAILDLYKFMNRSEPEIIFSPSPYSWFFDHVHCPSPRGRKQRERDRLIKTETKHTKQNFTGFGNSAAFDIKWAIEEKIYRENLDITTLETKLIWDWLRAILTDKTDDPYRNGPLLWGASNAVLERLNPQLQKWFISLNPIVHHAVHYQGWVRSSTQLEILEEVFHISHSKNSSQEREVLIRVAESCDYFYPYVDVCIICDHPTELHLNHRNLLHAEGQPAIVYRDGFKLYAYGGNIIPERYGKLSVSEWPLAWVKAEEDQMLRGILRDAIKDQMQ